MSLIASHHDLDLDVLEQLSVGADSLGAGVVADCQALTGAVVLATCNRFELYLEIDDVAQVDTTVEQVVARIARDSEVPVERVTEAVSYTHLRAHETRHDLVCRLLLEKK